VRALGWVVLAAAAGCGRYNFDLAPPDSRGIDATLGPFGPPTPIAELNTASAESDPALTADLLELYFDSDRAGEANIYVSKRASVDDAWGAPVSVPELSSTSFDGAPGITPDGLTIYISSSRPGGFGSLDIWSSTRTSRDAVWNAPVQVPELSTTEDDSNAQPSADELHMWMASKRGGFALRQLYSASRASTATAWSTPAAIAELNELPTEAAEAPWADEGFDIYFASNRTGSDGANDLWYATRTTLAEPFDAPIHIDELDTASGEQDPWLSADRRTILFMSRRNGSEDLYIATR
jgi:hypothetical protein